MASVRVLFLVASLAIALAATVAEPYPAVPACDVVCKGAKEQLLQARKKCCEEVSNGAKCLCPTMNTLIAAGVPLKDVCYDDMNCGKSEGLVVDGRQHCSVPDGACRELLGVLDPKKNPCILATHSLSGVRCIVNILTEAGFKNATGGLHI